MLLILSNLSFRYGICFHSSLLSSKLNLLYEYAENVVFNSDYLSQYFEIPI